MAGRWLSPDPSGWRAVSQAYPQSFNRYAYVQNNPMNMTDPNGLDCVYFNGDGTMSGTPVKGDCPEDAQGNPTDNGTYINATGVTYAYQNPDGSLYGYDTNGGAFDIVHSLIARSKPMNQLKNGSFPGVGATLFGLQLSTFLLALVIEGLTPNERFTSADHSVGWHIIRWSLILIPLLGLIALPAFLFEKKKNG